MGFDVPHRGQARMVPDYSKALRDAAKIGRFLLLNRRSVSAVAPPRDQTHGLPEAVASKVFAQFPL
jgi:hypothetical protein